MIIFLYGQDTYRLRQKLGEIIEHYKGVHKSGLNLRFFDGEEINYQNFKDEFQQIPMFQEKKLLIFKNIFQNQEFKNAFSESGRKFVDSKDIIVFQQELEITPKDPFFKFLVKNAKTQEFCHLDGVKLKNWAGKEFEKYEMEIQPQALWAMTEYVGNNLWQFSGEIKKLVAFKTCPPAGRKNKIVETKDVNLLVKPEIETDIFKTVEALASKNKKKAISLMHRHLEKGDNPLYLLSMINFQFRNLLVIKETGKISGHPYFVRKTALLAESFSREELRGVYRKIFEADIKIKTGQLDPQLALDLLITEI